MKNKKLFQKIVLIALAIAVLIALIAPAIFSQAMPAPKQEKLLNGLKVLMWPDSKADKVTVRIRIHAGSAFDPQGKEGVMQMLADNIFPNEAAREFFTEDLGGSLEIVTNYDFIQINASSKPENFVTMLETLSAAVSNPAIDKETTAKLRTELLARIKTLEADRAYVADQAVAKRLFGTFPYGRPQKGTVDSVQKIDFADLIDAKSRFLTADNATITISGNFDRSLGRKAASRLFGGWLKSDKKVPATFRQPDAPDTARLDITLANAANTELRFATRGLAQNDKDLAASRFLIKILNSRSLDLVRSNSALFQFTVSSHTYLLPGFFVFGYSLSGRESLKVSPIADLLGQRISDDEFAKARAESLAANTRRSVESQWLDLDTYKIPVADETQTVENVTIADVQRVADRLSKNPVVTVVVLPVEVK